MKKAIYTDSYINYYPIYAIGKLGIGYFTVVELLFLLSACPTAINASILQVFNWTYIVIPISIILYLLICLYLHKRMFLSIRLDITSISIINIKRKENIIIPWSKVERVLFHRETWPARDRYEFVLSEPINTNTLIKKSKSFSLFILVNDVNILELEKFIPTEKIIR